MKIYHELRCYEDNFKIWQKDYENMQFLAHWHAETEWIYVRDGNATILVGDRTVHAAAGDLIVCSGGCIHACVGFEGGNRLAFLVFDPHLICTDSALTATAPLYLPRAALEAAGLADSVRQVMDTAVRELSERGAHYRELLKATLAACFFSLHRAFPSAAVAATRRQAMTQQLLSYAEAHFREPITLAQAAAAFHFSPAHFSRLFSRLTGMPFLQYLHILRIEEAIFLLQTTELTVIDIALACGFNSARSFNRVFRSVTGSFPTRLRESGSIAPPPPRKAYDAVPVKNDSFVVLQ